MGEFKPRRGDCELLRAAREDAEAFGEFYRRHAVAVERWIRRQTPDPATAADLKQVHTLTVRDPVRLKQHQHQWCRAEARN